MKKIFVLVSLLVLAFQMGFSQTSSEGNPTKPGIVKTAEHAKSYVFDIQLKGPTSVEQARALDAALLSKYGILSAVTNATTQVCKVEVLKKVTERHLREVVEGAGFKIAKTFNQ